MTDMDSEDDDFQSQAVQRRLQPSLELSHHQSGPTVLPSHLANAVSLATRSSSMAIRIGTMIGSYGLDAARITTLSSLDLGQAILQGILSRAGSDVLARSSSQLARAEAETILERSLESLHQAMSQVVFWTTTGFYMAGTTFSVFSDLSQLLLSSLDQFFGSTDSSRAIASIITLIRREFYDPTTGIDGEHVGVVDLIMGLCALAYLQRKCWRLGEEESRRMGHEEIVWDVVVLNDGERIDVHEDSLYGVHSGSYADRRPDIMVSEPVTFPRSSILTAFNRYGADKGGSDEDENALEDQLRTQIMQTLPAEARVSISTSVTTQKTITVDFRGFEPPALPTPPGMSVIEREIISTHEPIPGPAHSTIMEDIPTFRVVYRIDKTQTNDSIHLGRHYSEQGAGDATIPSNWDHSPDVTVDTPVVSHLPLEATLPPALPPRPDQAPSLPAALHDYSVSNSAHMSSAAGQESTDANPRSELPEISHGVADTSANQKRQRTPLLPVQAKQRLVRSQPSDATLQKPLPKELKSQAAAEAKASSKKTGLRQVLKKTPGPNLSSFWNKNGTNSGDVSSAKRKQNTLPVAPAKNARKASPVPPISRKSMPRQGSDTTIKPASTPHRGHKTPLNKNPQNTPGLPQSSSPARKQAALDRPKDMPRSRSGSSSLHPYEYPRLNSPVSPHRPLRLPGDVFYEPDELYSGDTRGAWNASRSHHRRSRAHTPSHSVCSIATSNSQTSLVLSAIHPKSAFTDSEAIDTLRRDGTLAGIFPSFHLLRNVSRFMLFSSASYGYNFLKVMGISKEAPTTELLGDTHHEVRSFARHTQSQNDSILLTSFIDPQGGSDSTGSTGTGVPLVHYISLDHESKAVVLACRGTLGFEDVLADLACDYDDLWWRGKSYKVHKGVHSSARRLLYGGDGRVLHTLKEALDEFSDYGLVLCGHSLGGAVTALLGTMLATPSSTGTGFVTSAEPHRRLLTAESTGSSTTEPNICLPSGRPIHVYAYGPPATMSPSLRRATRGLITSIIQGNDIVPYLSLGVLHDFQSVALGFKSEGHDAKQELKQHIWQSLQTGLADKWYDRNAKTLDPLSGEDTWSIAALTSIRAGMTNPKLVPPGEVFAVESSRVLRRDAFLIASEQNVGKPAKRVVFKYIRDVEARFREMRFGTSMLIDHSPAKYEEALNKLQLGVTDVR